MTVTLQIYDELRSAILFDFNDSSGTNSGMYGSVTTKLASDLDLGSPRLESSSVTAQDIDATYSAFSKRATATMKLKVIISGTSYDNLTQATGTLANFLTQGCVLKYIAGTNTYYIDVLPSPTAALVAGGELAIYRAAALFQTEIDLELQRQPYLRGAALTPSVNVLSNPTLLRDSNADGTPDSWTKSGSGTLAVESATDSVLVTCNASAQGVTQTTGSASMASGQVWTFSADIAVTSGTINLFLEFLSSAPAILVSHGSSTLTADGRWRRVTLTSAASPATTDRGRVSIISQAAGASVCRIRNAQLEMSSTATPFRVSAQTVNLDPAATGFAKMIPVYNPSTAPAPMTITTAFPDASSNVQAMDYFLATSDGVVGNKYLSDYLNGPFYAQAEASGNGWTLTAGTDTTLAGTALATQSPGTGTSAAIITHSTDPNQYNKRITFTRTTLLDSLRGKHRVYAAVTPASKTNYRLQLAWSAGTSTTETNDEFVLKQTDNRVVARVLCDLGTIELPENTGVTLNGLVLELSTKMGTGKSAANLYVDYLMLVPQDNSAHVELPDMPDSITSVTQGADMQSLAGGGTPTPKDLGAGDPTWNNSSGTGTVILTKMKLNGLNQAAGVGSNTTGAFTGSSGGIHAVRFYLKLNAFIGTVNVEVANVSDSDLLDVAGNSMSLTYTYATSSYVTLSPTIIVNEELNDKYQPRVTITSYTSGSLTVDDVTTTPLYVMAQNQQLRTDPGSTGLDRYAAERLDASSHYVAALSADRVPFWIPPGLSLLWVEAYDGVVDTGGGVYTSPGGAELPHLNARTLTVTPTVYPRWWA